MNARVSNARVSAQLNPDTLHALADLGESLRASQDAARIEAAHTVHLAALRSRLAATHTSYKALGPGLATAQRAASLRAELTASAYELLRAARPSTPPLEELERTLAAVLAVWDAHVPFDVYAEAFLPT